MTLLACATQHNRSRSTAMAKKARTSRPRRAAAPADGFAAPPQEMDLEEEEPAPRRKKEPLVPLEHVIAKCPRAELEDLILLYRRPGGYWCRRFGYILLHR